MNKSLAPLIIFLLIIIACTFFIVRFRPEIKGVFKPYSSELENTKEYDIPLSGQVDNIQLNIQGSSIDSVLKPKSEMSLYRSLGAIRILLTEGKLQEAEDSLRSLLVFYPNNRTVLSLLGGVLYTSGEYGKAESMFRRMVQNNMDDYIAKQNLGLALEKETLYEKAIDEFLDASLQAPNPASAYLHMAGIYSVIGNNKKALLNFIKAYEILDYEILPLTFDPAFDNIRESPVFINIIFEAEQKINDLNNNSEIIQDPDMSILE